MRTHSQQQAALTRAEHAGPQAVIRECERVVRDDWHDQPWPDDWHRWNIAYDDAHRALAHAGHNVPPQAHLDNI